MNECLKERRVRKHRKVRKYADRQRGKFVKVIRGLKAKERKEKEFEVKVEGYLRRKKGTECYGK